MTAGGASATNTLMNERTLKACDIAKAAGIEIYTIRLEEPNVATGTMLKECASAPDHYFDVPSRVSARRGLRRDQATGSSGVRIAS